MGAPMVWPLVNWPSLARRDFASRSLTYGRLAARRYRKRCNLAAQTEGSIVFGLGHVLREKITIKEGRVQESNFNDYQVPRMSDMPNITVRVISTDNPPTGAGEDGLPLVGGAIGNAVAALTGVRLRELPFAPDRVRGALGA